MEVMKVMSIADDEPQFELVEDDAEADAETTDERVAEDDEDDEDGE